MTDQRTIAIGDVHGCDAALAAVLDAVQPARGDRIVMLGDCVDRGPDSRSVIDRLITLADHCRLEWILGNHEEMLLSVIDGTLAPHFWLVHGGNATLESYGFSGQLDCIPESHLQFFRTALPYVETESHILLHASYDPQLALDQQPDRLLRWESLEAGVPDPHCSGKTAVVGHTAQRDGEIGDWGHLLGIDTYCYGGGWLTALQLETGTVWQADRTGKLRAASSH